MLIFRISSANGGLYSRGAYFYGVRLFESKVAVAAGSSARPHLHMRWLKHSARRGRDVNTPERNSSLAMVGMANMANWGISPICHETTSLLSVGSGTCSRPIFIGCLFLMGAYTRESMQEAVIGAYFQGVLILCGCLFLRFYGKSGWKLEHHHGSNKYK